MSNRVDEIAAAVADGDAVDWVSAEAASSGDDERRIVRELRELARLTASHSRDTGIFLRRRLPMLAGTVTWLSAARTLVGAVGTIVAVRQLDIPRLPFVLAVLLSFALAA